MKLLNATTLRLHEFFGYSIPFYVILSHTWDEDEVTLQDIANSSYATKKGFAKVRACCAQALRDGFIWVWIDTCCIDKTSSADLSEAINSMFSWYQNATVCYVFLSDLPAQKPGRLDYLAFKSTKWFTRGWTLQELLAPRRIEFYDCDWNEVGTKCSLEYLIHTSTGIRRDVLSHNTLISSLPVAERMSWASKRRTTRQEDIAYCLLGIFDIHIPLLYGEGDRAFARLQQEIIRTSEDLSILLWTQISPLADRSGGVLAQSPDVFEKIHLYYSGNSHGHGHDQDLDLNWNQIKRLKYLHSASSSRSETELPAPGNPRAGSKTVPPTITSRGLHVQLPEVYLSPNSTQARYLWTRYILTISDAGCTKDCYLCIEVKCVDPEDGLYVRSSIGHILALPMTTGIDSADPEQLYLSMESPLALAGEELDQHYPAGQAPTKTFTISLEGNHPLALQVHKSDPVGQHFSAGSPASNRWIYQATQHNATYILLRITETLDSVMRTFIRDVVVGVRLEADGRTMTCSLGTDQPQMLEFAEYSAGIQAESWRRIRNSFNGTSWSDRSFQILSGQRFILRAAVKPGEADCVLVLRVDHWDALP